MSLIVHVGLAQAHKGSQKSYLGAGCRTMYFHTYNLHHQTEKSRVNYNSGFFFWVSLKNPSDGVSAHGSKGQCRTIRAWLLPEGNHRESYGWTLSGREKPPKTYFRDALMRAGGLFGNAQKGAAAEPSDGKRMRSPGQAKVMPEAPTKALSRDAVFFFCGGPSAF